VTQGGNPSAVSTVALHRNGHGASPGRAVERSWINANFVCTADHAQTFALLVNVCVACVSSSRDTMHFNASLQAYSTALQSRSRGKLAQKLADLDE
jgi:hypothetical protein